ncbi:hypothetical protein MKW92_031894 [Papaver armeniacum]|nr:hypothetical protein MKW92_031894 [Papaver armeniacum]
MASGVDPVPIQSELGGSYYLTSRNGDKIAVAKPVDEEPLAKNIRNGYTFGLGETGVREVAAYLLDHNGFAGVPPTALVKISHVSFQTDNSSNPTNPTKSCKTASLQRFVDHDFDAGDLGPSGFSVSSVHRIGILDVRISTLTDMQEIFYDCYPVGLADLVPIDHELCLPDLLDDPYFEWLHWPQASVPFSESEAEYISRLDLSKDAELLRKELPSLTEPSIRILVLCTIFLKLRQPGICLADIGDMMTRQPVEQSKNQVSFLGTFIEWVSHAVLSPLPEEDNSKDNTNNKMNDPNEEHEDGNGQEDEMTIKQNGLMKSVSFSVSKQNYQSEGITFKWMSEEKFKLFLESFEKLLPKAFEGKRVWD